MRAKTLKRAYSALLSIMLIIGLLPTAVFAASPTTLNVNGESILTAADNKVVCGEGIAEYDPESNTLTLTNATIEGDFSGQAAIHTYNGDLTIRLIGENTITSGWYGVYSNNSTITIGGSGTLTIHAVNDGVRAANVVIGIAGETEAPIINVTGKENYASGIYATNTLTIQNGANVTAKSEAEGYALCGENGIAITGSTVNATVDGSEINVIACWGNLSIDSSTVRATGTSEQAFPAIYAFGNINVTNKSNIEAISNGMRGIYTDSNMTVIDSTVTATGTIREGMVVVGALSLTNSKLTASSKPNDIIPAIVTKNFNVTNSEVTAKGGFDLLDWNEGNTDGISLSITPAEGKLAEFKVDGNNWDGSAAVHFKEGQKSPYDESVNFTADEMNWLGAYRYIHIGEHIHTGGTATCIEPAKCEDCGRAYGTVAGHNFEHGACTVCGAADPDYVPPTPVYIYYDIIASAGEGGTITPDGNSRVLRGTDKTFTITPDSDYVVSDVLVDGKSAGAVTSYTFETVREDHSIQVLFELSEEAQEAIRNEKLKKGVESTTIRLRSTLGNGFIRLDWEKSAGYKVDYYEVYKSTKRYSGYGTEPYFETKQGGLTGWYKNTKELKKGVRYYYKVRGVREIAGETVYTKWSTKAWRLVK